MPRVLIVAYGNPLRCDDGVAWRAGDALEAKFSTNQVEIVRLHQLAPELAEAVSRSALVIFVDAAAAESDRPPGDVRCEEINLAKSESRFTHHLSPQAVLSLAAQLYNARPRAFSVTLTGQCFDHGESLSPGVLAALPELVTRIETVIQQFKTDSSG